MVSSGRLVVVGVVLYLVAADMEPVRLAGG
jgi:hypothetical protein